MSRYGTPGMPLVPAGGGVGPPPVPFSPPKTLFRYGEQSLWSSTLLVAGAIANSINRLFTTPLGQVGQNFARAMSIGETNIKEGGRCPNGVAYDVFGIAAQIVATSGDGDAATTWGTTLNTAQQVQNLVDIMNNGVLTWDFTQTQVDIAPINLIGSGGGVFGSLGLVANNLQLSGNVGNGAGSIWMYRKHPVALPGSTTFSILLRMGNRASAIAGTAFAVKVALMGYYKNIIEIG
jgi:hypothetical protein